MSTSRILLIDDEENFRHMLSVILKKRGYDVETAKNGIEGLKKVETGSYDTVLCDIRMPEMDGLEFLKEAQKAGCESTIIMMSAFGTLDTAIEAMKLGAYDYISKPFKPDEIILTLKKAEERERLRRENLFLKKEVQKEYSFDNIISKNERMRQIFDTIRKVAKYKSTILITGESGTGKELVAKAIHFNSDRSNNPFVPVNCGAIPENLLESELFGHTKGSFTNAVRTKKGLFEEADEGTMFLDEIGELPFPLLVDHFIHKYSRELNHPIQEINQEALNCLLNYSWNGNVRELENVIERAIVLTDSNQIQVENLPLEIQSPREESMVSLLNDELSIKKASRYLEMDLIKKALHKTNGNHTHAAKLLEISHRALLYKIKEYGVKVKG